MAKCRNCKKEVFGDYKIKKTKKRFRNYAIFCYSCYNNLFNKKEMCLGK